jgi:ELWxxDGT repeat protein
MPTFFVAADSTHGNELWITDGIRARLAADINPGLGNSSPNNLTSVPESGAVFFAASDGVHGQELWRSDGTVAGTVMVRTSTPVGWDQGLPISLM